MPAQTYLFPCLKDNYGVLLHDPESGATAAIDAPEAAPVEAALKKTGWRLTDILVTHHHGDHTAGIGDSRRHHKCRVVAPRNEAQRIAHVDETVGEGDTVRVGSLDRAGDRDARPYRRPHLLFLPGGQTCLCRRHAVFDRLRPRHRRQSGNDVAIAAQAARPARRHADFIAATNIPTPISASPRPSSRTTRRWPRAPQKSRSCSPPASRLFRRRSARKRRRIRFCAPICPKWRKRSVSPAVRHGKCSRKSASAKIGSRPSCPRGGHPKWVPPSRGRARKQWPDCRNRPPLRR